MCTEGHSTQSVTGVVVLAKASATARATESGAEGDLGHSRLH